MWLWVARTLRTKVRTKSGRTPNAPGRTPIGRHFSVVKWWWSTVECGVARKLGGKVAIGFEVGPHHAAKVDDRL